MVLLVATVDGSEIRRAPPGVYQTLQIMVYLHLKNMMQIIAHYSYVKMLPDWFRGCILSWLSLKQVVISRTSLVGLVGECHESVLRILSLRLNMVIVLLEAFERANRRGLDNHLPSQAREARRKFCAKPILRKGGIHQWCPEFWLQTWPVPCISGSSQNTKTQRAPKDVTLGITSMEKANSSKVSNQINHLGEAPHAEALPREVWMCEKEGCCQQC